jgi:hypothetical protein
MLVQLGGVFIGICLRCLSKRRIHTVGRLSSHLLYSSIYIVNDSWREWNANCPVVYVQVYVVFSFSLIAGPIPSEVSQGHSHSDLGTRLGLRIS